MMFKRYLRQAGLGLRAVAVFCSVITMSLAASPISIPGPEPEVVLVGGGLPREERVPGGIAVVDTGITEHAPPTVFFGPFRVPVVRAANSWLAIVGLPLAQPLGSAAIRLETGQGQRELKFNVIAKAYAVQKLSVAGKYVNPPAEVEARIAREQAETNAIFSSFSALPALFSLQKPALGVASSSFGLRREFNGEARNPHSGMDIAGAKGDAVIAAGSGRVVLAKALYFNGNTIIIDHGMSLFSLYCHLDNMAVESGQTIAAGARIGSIGATGRVTGPHLHWSVSLSGARVNPALFLIETLPEKLPETQAKPLVKSSPAVRQNRANASTL